MAQLFRFTKTDANAGCNLITEMRNRYLPIISVLNENVVSIKISVSIKKKKIDTILLLFFKNYGYLSISCTPCEGTGIKAPFDSIDDADGLFDGSVVALVLALL